MKLLEIQHSIQEKGGEKWIDTSYRVIDTENYIDEFSPVDDFNLVHKVNVGNSPKSAQDALLELIEQAKARGLNWADSITQAEIGGLLKDDPHYPSSYIYEWTGRKSEPSEDEIAAFIAHAKSLKEDS